MNNQQNVSREEYRRQDNRVTCILQQRWPANEISQWVGMLQGKQQAVACAILRRRHPVRCHRPHPLYRTWQPHRPRQPGRSRKTQPDL